MKNNISINIEKETEIYFLYPDTYSVKIRKQFTDSEVYQMGNYCSPYFTEGKRGGAMPLYSPQRGRGTAGEKSHCPSTKREGLQVKNGLGAEMYGYLGRTGIQKFC